MPRAGDPRRRRLLAGVAVALVLHAGLGAALLMDRGGGRSGDPPPMLVRLVRPAAQEATRAEGLPQRSDDAHPRVGAGGAPAPSTSSAAAPDSSEVIAHAASPSPPAAPAGPGDDGATGRVTATLRGWAGCEQHLDRDAERDCRRLRAEAAGPAPQVPAVGRDAERRFTGWRDPRKPRTELTTLPIPGGAIGLPPPIAVVRRAPIPVPKALPAIPPSTLRGDDDALRPRVRGEPPGGDVARSDPH